MRDSEPTLLDRLPRDQAKKLADFKQTLLLREGDPQRILAEIPEIIQDLQSPDGIPMIGSSFRVAAQAHQNRTS